jgi:excisionase family DNA binding protein
MDDKLLYTVPEVARHLSLSRSKVYELVRAGVLPSVKIDRVRRLRGADVMAFIESLRSVA